MTKCATWNMESYFDEFNGRKMQEFKTDLHDGITKLVDRASSLEALNNDNSDEWESIIMESEVLGRNLNHLASYIGCLASADTGNEEYAREMAETDEIIAQFGKIFIFIKTGFKTVDESAFEKFTGMENIREISFHMRELRREAQKTMPAELEALNADLSVNGFSSWDRLYSTIAGKLKFKMHWPDGRVEETPISQCRSLMQDSDREVRKAAFENGNKAWESVEDVCAAALNSIAGTRLTLNEKRGVEHFLDVSLEQSRITRKTLDAMFSAIEDNRPFISRIGKAKAKALGLEKLAWYDCEAPLKIPGINRYSWQECIDMLGISFRRAYPEMADFLHEALEKRWVDSEPAARKRPGAFCSSSSLIEESRVFMSYNGSFNDISTLAHEIGHAFHNRQLKGQRPFLREYPMTLAESASTFAELILGEGVLDDPESTDAQKLNVLTGSINHCISFLIDIPIRFNFEKAFHEERMSGTLSPSRFKQLMQDAMEKQFGDLLEEGLSDKMFWASKMHFYITGVSFYNYPYTFGYLLSRGLYEMFKKEGGEFLPRYRDFLKQSGSMMAHDVARNTLNVDLEEKDFWNTAILGHEKDLIMFEELSPKVLG